MRFRFDGFELDTDTFELRADGRPVTVEPQVFDVLVHLLTNRDRVVTKEELLDQVWGDRFVSESALSSRIMSARRAVGDDGRRQAVIKTVHGRGFRFVADVELLEEATAATDAVDASTTATEATPAPVSAPLLLRRAPRTRYARSRSGSVAYQVVGDGPRDIVFVPGFVSNVELQWEFPPMADFFARLAAFSRLIVFDKRGTGLSEPLPSDLPSTLEDRMDDVRAVMDAAGSERATLMGISEGGPMSVLFAATYPERVERLVLVNTFAGSFGVGVSWTGEDVDQWWGTGTVYEFLAPSWAGDRDDRAFMARYERNSATPAAATATITMNEAIDVRPVLGSVSVPTLVVHRRGDEVIPYERGREIAEGIPGARLVALDGSDHLAFVEPTALLDEVEAFVTGEGPASTADRTLLTIVFVDIVDSTSTAERVGDRAWRRLLDRFYALVRTEVRHGRGRVVSNTGDGVLATFDGPARAIRTGLAMVEACAALGLQLRIGIHTGEVERLDGDLVGINVHVGARVAASAAPGEVWTTRTVRDLVAGSGLVFEPRGAHDLKGVSEARELFAVR